MNLPELINKYLGGFEKQEHPFLLFDLAHVNENDHTRVLSSILQFDNDFLKSFLHSIGIVSVFKEFVEKPTTQKIAIGQKGKGFIDLYFKYYDEKDAEQQVIIENKIYDAADTDKQLARYIATALGLDPSKKEDKKRFEEIWEQWEKGSSDPDSRYDCFEGIHVVYLSSDGSKKPDNKSLPKYFRKEEDSDVEHIKYYPVNYLEHIIPWLENDVLPRMPYADEGIAIAGVRQYLSYLKAMFSVKRNSSAVEEFVKAIDGLSDLEKYNTLLDTMDSIKNMDPNCEKAIKQMGIDKDDARLRLLIRDLRSAAISIFSDDGKDLEGDWKLYFTPSYIFLFRQKWADLDTRKYSIPSLYFMASTTKFLQGKDIAWNLQVDHIDSLGNYKEWCPDFTPQNRNKTVACQIFDGEGVSVDINNAVARKEYYTKLLEKEHIKNVVQLVNRAVENVEGSKIQPFQKDLLKLLQDDIKSISVKDTFK